MTVAEIKAAVRERDGNRCVDCGMTGQEHLQRHGNQLHVHRLKRVSPYTIDGCVSVCAGCHRRRHRGKRTPYEGVGLVHEVLKAKGWSKTRLAAELHRTEAVITNWLTEKSIPRGPAAILMRMWLEQAREPQEASAP